MTEKSLSDSEWKKFAKGRNLKDAPFLKALAALDAAKDAQARLAALDDIGKQADALRKASKADKAAKDIGNYLDDVDKALGRERKLAEAEAKKTTAKAAEAAAADEDEASQALLTSKLIPLLHGVRKGEPMKTLVAIGGRDSAALLSRKQIAPAQRKLLLEYLGVTGGVKFAPGECIWEENAVTFVLQTQAAGLAKKLQAALLKQTGMRWKVRVRGEDPNDIDDDGESQGEHHEAGHDEHHEKEPVVDYAQCRADWQQAKTTVHLELQKLEQAILAEYRGAPGYQDLVGRIRKVDGVLAEFSEGLSEALARAANEADAAARRRYHDQAALVIRKYLDRSANDPFIHQLESNPFVAITAKATLVGTLGRMARLIG